MYRRGYPGTINSIDLEFIVPFLFSLRHYLSQQEVSDMDRKPLNPDRNSSKMKGRGSVIEVATPTKLTKIQKSIDKYVKELIQIDNLPNEGNKVQLKQEIFEKAASNIQSKHSYTELIRKENELVRQRDTSIDLDIEKLTELDYGIKIVRLAQEQREKGHQKNEVSISKAILESGAIMFASSRKTTKKDSKKVVELEKHANGEKVLTYYNPLGKASKFDSRVFIGLHKLWEDKGKNQKFTFTLYELCKVLNLTANGKNYQNIEHSLEVLFNMSVEMRYYIKQKDEKITTRFHMLSADETITKISPSTNKNRTIQRSVIFSDFLQLSLLEGYVSYISLALLEDIQKDTAHHLYLLLTSSKISEYGRCEYEFDDLCDIIGIKREYPKYKKKQLLNEAILELIEVKVLSRHQYPKGTSKVFLYPSDWFATIINTEGSVITEKANDIPLLIERIESHNRSIS